MQARESPDDTQCRMVSKDKNLSLFVGSSESVRSALQAEMLLEHIEHESTRTLFVEHSLSYEAMVRIVHDRSNVHSNVIVFERIVDINTLMLILVQLESGMTVWAGLEAMDSQNAIERVQAMITATESTDKEACSLSKLQLSIQTCWKRIVESKALFEIIDLGSIEKIRNLSSQDMNVELGIL